VSHEVKPLPDVRRPETASRGNNRPDGVATTFQVSRNKVEPSKSVTTRNLLPKDRDRSALSDEPEPFGPEMPRVICTPALSGHAEWLTGAAPGPDCSAPSRLSEGEGPTPDAGECVKRLVAVLRLEFNDAPLVYRSVGQMTGGYQIAKPLRGIGIELVVESAEDFSHDR
jgi:hypothetical protein